MTATCSGATPNGKPNHSWQSAFVISSVIYFLGAICWLFIDPVTPLANRAAS